MPIVEKSVLIAHSAERMFDLVADVEAYPQFLPWCAGARVLSRTVLDDGDARVVATIDIRYASISQSFTTENHERRGQFITMAFRDGPFRKLDGGWTFTPLDANACKVGFRLDYEFSSKLLSSVLGPVFDHIARTFVDGFVKRAEQRVG